MVHMQECCLAVLKCKNVPQIADAYLQALKRPILPAVVYSYANGTSSLRGNCCLLQTTAPAVQPKVSAGTDLIASRAER